VAAARLARNGAAVGCGLGCWRCDRLVIVALKHSAHRALCKAAPQVMGTSFLLPWLPLRLHRLLMVRRCGGGTEGRLLHAARVKTRLGEHLAALAPQQAAVGLGITWVRISASLPVHAAAVLQTMRHRAAWVCVLACPRPARVRAGESQGRRAVAACRAAPIRGGVRRCVRERGRAGCSAVAHCRRSGGGPRSEGRSRLELAVAPPKGRHLPARLCQGLLKPPDFLLQCCRNKGVCEGSILLIRNQDCTCARTQGTMRACRATLTASACA
jgi:hypothetical protein